MGGFCEEKMMILDLSDNEIEKRRKYRERVMFWILMWTSFLGYVMFSMPGPLLPLEAGKKGTSQTTVGFIFSCFEFVIFVTSPIFGYFLTKIGPKFLFVSGIFICGCCSVLFGVLDKCPPGNIFIVMCFLCRTVEALGCSMFVTASFAIIAYEFPNSVATVFGTLETFSGLGLMLGPPIGGALYELGGYGLPFWVMGSVLILCGLVSFCLMPEEDETRPPFKGSLLSILRSPLVMVVCFTIFCGSFSLGFLDPTLASHLEKFNLSTFEVGLIFLCAPGVYGLTAPIFGYLGDSTGWVGGMMAVGCATSGVMFLFLGPAPFLPFLPYTLWLIIVTLLVFGATVGVALITTFKGILNGAKQLGFEENLDTFGLVSGLFNSTFSLGAFVGPSLGGVIADRYGFDWASASCGFLYIVAVFVKLRNLKLFTKLIYEENQVFVRLRNLKLFTKLIYEENQVFVRLRNLKLFTKLIYEENQVFVRLRNLKLFTKLIYEENQVFVRLRNLKLFIKLIYGEKFLLNIEYKSKMVLTG
ncbi:hypothetical protein LOTGIDRAFT_236779 [Lottia gigantea]|uniref:Major facilitator superfamily (MFS) profile domain-containing protein n=1 Tax=Lottia gigantea TaxID=225164 RepID=V3ZGA3_LOTGI|nr:hypothetical protein LOTGIDRAFT_236779 [Lottia gigantea]ESO83182.1 hypothetical protein LOTGIDRAFT_236779 [Lottia gigantea]